MKKFIALTLTAVMLIGLVACSDEVAETSAPAETNVSEGTDADAMSYADYVAAAMDEEVVIDAYVMATQSWWDNKITAYLADEDGAYFCYEMACSEEDAALLVPGAEIVVTGYKSEWSGEVEIVDATFEYLGQSDVTFEPVDVTDLLGSDELIDYQNRFVSFTDMTVVSVAFKNDEPGDDIYLTLSKDDAEYSFCLEYYLNGSDAEFYDLVAGLEAGLIVDVEGYLYWYEGANPHITSVVVK